MLLKICDLNSCKAWGALHLIDDDTTTRKVNLVAPSISFCSYIGFSFLESVFESSRKHPGEGVVGTPDNDQYAYVEAPP